MLVQASARTTICLPVAPARSRSPLFGLQTTGELYSRLHWLTRTRWTYLPYLLWRQQLQARRPQPPALPRIFRPWAYLALKRLNRLCRRHSTRLVLAQVPKKAATATQKGEDTHMTGAAPKNLEPGVEGTAAAAAAAAAATAAEAEAGAEAGAAAETNGAGNMEEGAI
jgi:hypothetical protein